MARGATWTNSDGLVVPFGTHTADNGVPAVTAGAGMLKTMVMEIVGIDLPDTYAATDTEPQAATIKRGSVIQSATLHVHEAFTSGGAATLDIGTWSKGLATDVVDDADGIDAAIAITAIDGLGDIINCDGALVGLLVPVGRTADGDCVIAPSYNTAAFTAGKATLTVVYIESPFAASIAA